MIMLPNELWECLSVIVAMELSILHCHLKIPQGTSQCSKSHLFRGFCQSLAWRVGQAGTKQLTWLRHVETWSVGMLIRREPRHLNFDCNKYGILFLMLSELAFCLLWHGLTMLWYTPPHMFPFRLPIYLVSGTWTQQVSSSSFAAKISEVLRCGSLTKTRELERSSAGKSAFA